MPPRRSALQEERLRQSSAQSLSRKSRVAPANVANLPDIAQLIDNSDSLLGVYHSPPTSPLTSSSSAKRSSASSVDSSHRPRANLSSVKGASDRSRDRMEISHRNISNEREVDSGGLNPGATPYPRRLGSASSPRGVRRSGGSGVTSAPGSTRRNASGYAKQRRYGDVRAVSDLHDLVSSRVDTRARGSQDAGNAGIQGSDGLVSPIPLQLGREKASAAVSSTTTSTSSSNSSSSRHQARLPEKLSPLALGVPAVEARGGSRRKLGREDAAFLAEDQEAYRGAPPLALERFASDLSSTSSDFHDEDDGEFVVQIGESGSALRADRKRREGADAPVSRAVVVGGELGAGRGENRRANDLDEGTMSKRWNSMRAMLRMPSGLTNNAGESSGGKGSATRAAQIDALRGSVMNVPPPTLAERLRAREGGRRGGRGAARLDTEREQRTGKGSKYEDDYVGFASEPSPMLTRSERRLPSWVPKSVQRLMRRR